MAAVSNKELERRLIIESKSWSWNRIWYPRHAGDISSDIWPSKPRALPRHFRALHYCSKPRVPSVYSSCSRVSHVVGISGLWKQWNVTTCYTLYGVDYRLIDLFSTMSWFSLQMETGIWPGFAFFAISKGSQCSGGDLDGDDYTVIWAPVGPICCLG